MTATRPEESSSEPFKQPGYEGWVEDLDRTLEALDSQRRTTTSAAPLSAEGAADPQAEAATDATSTDTQSATPQTKQSTSPSTWIEQLVTPKTLHLARLLGYGLLVIGFVDLLYILLPPQLTNPIWEYQAIGDIVKLVPVPLLALLLVFAGEHALRRKREPQLLAILSWLTLVISILFFLLLPLIITDAFRIDRFNKTQIATEVAQQKRKLNATKKQLQNMDGDQLKYFIPTPDKTGSLGLLPNSPAQAKTSIAENLERAKEKADTQAEEARRNVTANLVKNTFKLFAESLISAFLFLMIWSRTEWARQRSSKRKKRSAKAAKANAVAKPDRRAQRQNRTQSPVSEP
ncbi:MAG TPA: HpsJ family protein [Stenomitos sp.]